MANDPATQAMAEALVEALFPLNARARAMFGGYSFYIDDKIAGMVCDGSVFVKPSPHDDLIGPHADLAPAYPGAKDTWRLKPGVLEQDPDGIRDIIEQIVETLPAPKPKRR